MASVSGDPLPLMVPQHLERPRNDGQTFGTLVRWRSWGEEGVQDRWTIEGDPQVIVLAKRLFPGSAGYLKGHVTFPATPRILEDLNWLMQRWPLTIADPEAWEAEYQRVVASALRRAELNRNPVQTFPPALFTGELKPFQAEGLSWLLTNRRTLLADEMGLGKTCEALAFLATAAEWPALVVVPPHLVPHWERQVAQFLSAGEAPTPWFDGTPGVRVNVIRGMRPSALPDAHIHIIHYLLLKAWRQELKRLGFPTLIFDEVQELRHTGTEKYSAASDLSDLATNVIGLSGTPIHNRGGEIWNVMNIMNLHCLGDHDGFTKEWCCGYGSGPGSEMVEHPEVLGAHLRREGLMIRRRKEEVLGDLPAKRRVVESLEGDHKVFRELIREAVRIVKGADALEDPLARGREEWRAIKETRRATGLAKAPAVAAFVRGLMEAEEPTLLFLHHHDVVDDVLRRLAEFNPVCITGRQTQAEKNRSREAFMKGETNLIIISLRSAAGLDGLQERARVVAFGELDWSPAVHSQGEDRAHRWGLKDSILCYYLVTDLGTDPEMMDCLGLKISQFVELMGDKPETEEDRMLAGKAATRHMRGVITKLRTLGKLAAAGGADGEGLAAALAEDEAEAVGT